jgi:hypothetical protein
MLYRARMEIRRCLEDNWIDDPNSIHKPPRLGGMRI